MDEKEKQIEEMALDIECYIRNGAVYDEYYGTTDLTDVELDALAKQVSEELYKKGYRKQSEVVREIASQLRNIFINEYSLYGADCTQHTGERDSNINVPFPDVLEIINAVARKYGVEMENEQ